MTCRTERAGAQPWRFCPHALSAAGSRLRALVRARVVDEIDGSPVRVTEVSTPDRHLALHLVPRVSWDGVVGLAGHPARLFPDLAANPVSIPMRISARGYLPLDLAGTLGPLAGFPASFAPIDHGELRMHRVGVAFKGRVVERQTPSSVPLPNAQIAITGLWSVLPPPGVSPALLMEPPDLVSLTPGLYADRPAAILERCTFVSNPAAAKPLLRPAVPGERRLRLANRTTLAAGMPLLIDPDDPGRREVIGIAAVDTTFSDDQPAWVELDHPLRYLHRPRARVLPAAVLATQDPRPLARPGQRGDPVAFLDAAAPWPALSLVRIDDGIGAVEYQWADRFETVADGDGFFRLPRLSRIALFQLRATHGSQPQPLVQTLEPDYGRAEQVLPVAFE